MDAPDIERYRNAFLSDPSAFVEGVRGFCRYKDGGLEKTAQVRSAWDIIKPLLVALAIGYGGMKLGSGWGRYANKTKNPNGPVKGPIMKLVEGFLPKDKKIYWPGQDGYDDLVAKRDNDYMDWRRDKFGDLPWDGDNA